MFPLYFPFLFDFLKATVSDTLGCNDADARVRLIAANYASILENLVIPLQEEQTANKDAATSSDASRVAESKTEEDSASASTNSDRPGACATTFGGFGACNF